MRDRIFRRAATDGVNPLLFTTVMPFNATLIQWLWVCDSTPVNNDNFLIQRIHAAPNPYPFTIDLVKQDPLLEGDQKICTESFEFEKGDTCRVYYLNSSAIDFTAEVVFKEGN